MIKQMDLGYIPTLTVQLMKANGKMMYKMGKNNILRYGMEKWNDGSQYEGYYQMGKKHG